MSSLMSILTIVATISFALLLAYLLFVAVLFARLVAETFVGLFTVWNKS